MFHVRELWCSLVASEARKTERNCKMTYACIQPNGEHLAVEEWVLTAYREGRLTDPMLLRVVRGAVKVKPFGWPEPSEKM